MSQPDHLTFVCTGNTCRSPMAAALTQHALAAEPPPLNQLKVRSAGLAAFGGDPASENTIRALKTVDIPLAQHTSQPFDDSFLTDSLAILCMTASHRAALVTHFGEDATQHVYLMRQFLPEQAGHDIPDPFGMPLEQYEATRDSMVEAIPTLIQFLKQKLTQS